MKNFKFLSIFILLLGFVLALVQCTKEATSEDELSFSKQQIAPRVDDETPCKPNLSLYSTKNVLQGGIYLPGWPGCEVKGEFIYSQKGNSFVFTDFILIIPETPGCSDLRNYLDNLSQEEHEAEITHISEYVQAEGQRLILQSYSDGPPPILEVKDVKTYRSLCVEMCRWYDPSCHIDQLEEEIREPELMRSRTDDSCWKYTWRQCGYGCCMTTSNYSRVNGILRLTSAVTESFGECSSGLQSKWPRYSGKCPPWSDIVVPCATRCTN